MKSDFGYLNYKCLKIAIAYKRTRPFVRTADLYKWTTTYTYRRQWLWRKLVTVVHLESECPGHGTPCGMYRALGGGGAGSLNIRKL